MIVFVIPVTVVQGLLHLEGLQKRSPFMSGVLKSKFIICIVTGYFPSVVLVLFLHTVPPTMYLFSTIEGAISRSSRKKSACCKVLYFLIWNVFFVNVLSGKVIERLSVVSSPKDVTAQLATAVPTQILNAYVTSYESGESIGLLCKDELCGRMEEMHKKFPKAYDLFKDIPLSHCEDRDGNTRLQDLEDIKPGNLPIQSWMTTLFLGRFYSVHNFVANLQQMVLLRGLVDNPYWCMQKNFHNHVNFGNQ